MILKVKDHPLKPVLVVVDAAPGVLVSVGVSWGSDPDRILHSGCGFTLLEATKHALDRASAPEDIRAAIIKELNEHDHNRK